LQKEKIRLDEYLLHSGLIKDKNQITSSILSGSVLVNERAVTKIGTLINKTDAVRIREIIKNYVSRGAYKLLGAFTTFKNLSVTNLVCLDLGASTGGFTQVLLEKGAKHVYSIDVGYGQLAQKLANDQRVTVIDRTHIKDIAIDQISIRTSKIFISMDLSFISLTQIFPYIAKLCESEPNIEWFGVSLIKPQFELHPSFLDKGIVKKRSDQLRAIHSVWRSIKKNNPRFAFLGLAESPIQGADGNHEFLLRWALNVSSDEKRSD
jgi:23S rRNA (cytidine1920-2'-O)/16S rRNA (cytidine1409-2'-O)-methyltransferase